MASSTSIAKTKYVGYKNKSYLPVYAHTSRSNKVPRNVTVYRLGKSKSASKYSGPLYSSKKAKKSKKTKTTKRGKTMKKMKKEKKNMKKKMKGGTMEGESLTTSSMYDVAGNYRGSGGDSVSPFGESTVPTGFVQDAFNVYNGGATFPDTFLKDHSSPVEGPVYGAGGGLTIPSILTDPNNPQVTMTNLAGETQSVDL